MRKKRAAGGAIVGAAATAITLKGALASPLGTMAGAEVDKLKQNLEETKQSVAAQSRLVIDQAQARLVGAVVRVSPSAEKPATPRAGKPAAAGPSAQPRVGAGTMTADSPARPGRYSQARIKNVLREAAVRHHLDPRLVLAVSYWESGWRQARVSETGATGIMQVQPATAEEAGPALLGRPVDITDPYDNADVGAAVLRENLDNFGDMAQALAAYYQGPSSLRENGMFSDTEQYVEGILSLAERMR
jgi:soluble lytic murein transglycosylase-like protein